MKKQKKSINSIYIKNYVIFLKIKLKHDNGLCAAHIIFKLLLWRSVESVKSFPFKLL